MFLVICSIHQNWDVRFLNVVGRVAGRLAGWPAGSLIGGMFAGSSLACFCFTFCIVCHFQEVFCFLGVSFFKVARLKLPDTQVDRVVRDAGVSTLVKSLPFTKYRFLLVVSLGLEVRTDRA